MTAPGIGTDAVPVLVRMSRFPSDPGEESEMSLQ